MTDLQRMAQVIEEWRMNLIILADALEEAGFRRMAEGWRWCQHNSLHPLRVLSLYVWRNRMEPIVGLGHELPHDVSNQLFLISEPPHQQRIGLQWYEARSTLEAYHRAAEAWARNDALENYGPADLAEVFASIAVEARESWLAMCWKWEVSKKARKADGDVQALRVESDGPVRPNP